MPTIWNYFTFLQSSTYNFQHIKQHEHIAQWKNYESDSNLNFCGFPYENFITFAFMMNSVQFRLPWEWIWYEFSLVQIIKSFLLCTQLLLSINKAINFLVRFVQSSKKIISPIKFIVNWTVSISRVFRSNLTWTIVNFLSHWKSLNNEIKWNLINFLLSYRHFTFLHRISLQVASRKFENFRFITDENC